MKISEIMIRNVYTVKPTDTVKKAALILYAHRITGVPVVNDENEVIGIISEKDILKAMYPEASEFHQQPLSNMDFEEMEDRYKDVARMKVEDLMVKNVITLPPDTPILKAASIMIINNIRRIPVVEDKKLVGIISQGHIHQAIFKRELDL
jgi:CBS domain-containing protein